MLFTGKRGCLRGIGSVAPLSCSVYLLVGCLGEMPAVELLGTPKDGRFCGSVALKSVCWPLFGLGRIVEHYKRGIAGHSTTRA